jgi:hypothetical protein
MTVWFLVVILAAGPGTIEQQIVVPMPTKHACETVLELEDIPTLSRVYYPNKDSELRDIRKRECRSATL